VQADQNYISHLKSFLLLHLFYKYGTQ
jgi:hypothetical protein